MSTSAILGAAVGLALTFGLVALLASGVTEAFSNILQMRARYLLTAFRHLVDHPTGAVPGGGKEKKTNKSLHSNSKKVDVTAAALDEWRTFAQDVAAGSPTQPPSSQLTLALFGHPMLRAMQGRRVGMRRDGRTRNPQYVAGEVFVRALVDTLLPEAVDTNSGGRVDPSVLDRLYTTVEALPVTNPLRRSLVAMIGQAQGDLTKFEQSLEAWYDAEMDRISGWYKRWAKVVLAGVGLVIAVLVNVDAVQLTHDLIVSEPLRQAVQTAADSGALCQDQPDAAARRSCAVDELRTLGADSLPIGYPASCNPFRGHYRTCVTQVSTNEWFGALLKMVGWLLTAFAVSFGAPFWFEALSKLGSLRSAGPPPATGSAGA